jgi:hypothetical protein
MTSILPELIRELIAPLEGLKVGFGPTIRPTASFKESSRMKFEFVSFM